MLQVAKVNEFFISHLCLFLVFQKQSMSIKASYFKKVFAFNFKARTSRGLMKDKTSWFVRMWDEANPDVVGLGECGPLPGLSVDAGPNFEAQLAAIIDNFNKAALSVPEMEAVSALIPAGFPSVLFGFETAVLDLAGGGRKVIFDNDFVRGERIPINGLIWMGDIDFMMGQISIKVSEGFNCIKLKVGGLDFERECDVLEYVRKRYFREPLTIRLDANGALKTEEVLYKLEEMAKFNIHSIEQPIKAGLSEMQELCRKSPIPVALDEELIGKDTLDEKVALLQHLRPQYIILKPTLHGGLKGCREWIAVAEQQNIGWWITSALESSIGLNAICQFTANYKTTLHQGLGTGMIYENNFESPLEVKEGHIFYSAKLGWDEGLKEVDS
jgi:o-succinylbenzoate synthase